MSDSEHPPWWHADAEGSDEEPNPGDVGTAAQEAVKLAASVVQWAEQSGLNDTLRGIAKEIPAKTTKVGSGDATDDGDD